MRGNGLAGIVGALMALAGMLIGAIFALCEGNYGLAGLFGGMLAFYVVPKIFIYRADRAWNDRKNKRSN
jgi:hypothetical protein